MTQETRVKAGGEEGKKKELVLRHVPPKRRLNFNGIHGVVSQKIELFLQFGNTADVHTVLRPVNEINFFKYCMGIF
jgi:hypothetical protein